MQNMQNDPTAAIFHVQELSIGAAGRYCAGLGGIGPVMIRCHSLDACGASIINYIGARCCWLSREDWSVHRFPCLRGSGPRIRTGPRCRRLWRFPAIGESRKLRRRGPSATNSSAGPADQGACARCRSGLPSSGFDHRSRTLHEGGNRSGGWFKALFCRRDRAEAIPDVKDGADSGNSPGLPAESRGCLQAGTMA